MSFNDAVDVISKIAGVLVPLVALWIAYKELGKWRRELVGKNQVELAQRVGLLAVTFRNQFNDATSPGFDLSLALDRHMDEMEEIWQEELLDEEHAKLKLIERLSETLDELKKANTEAEIFFDKDISIFLEVYEKALGRVNLSTWRYFELQKKHHDTRNETILDRMKKARDVIDGQDKALLNQVNDTTAQLKLYAKKYLK